MSLTIGPGPLAARDADPLNYSLDGAPKHRLFLARDQRRIRAVVGDTVVLDTTRAALLHESQLLPVVYAPLEDYRQDLLTRTSTSTHCPFKGDASYWTLRVGERVVEDALWAYEEPNAESSWLRGLGALWANKVDAWFVEEDRVVGHVRDPFHRVDAHVSTREAVVRVGGTEVARTPRPVLIFETGLPLRVYVPPADIVPDAIAPGSGKRSLCPYKGEATYWTVAGVRDAAWSYETPLPDALRAQGHLSFDDSIEEIDVELG